MLRIYIYIQHTYCVVHTYRNDVKMSVCDSVPLYVRAILEPASLSDPFFESQLAPNLDRPKLQREEFGMLKEWRG